MVVNFKVDGNGKVWILWSNSIRLESVAVESRMKLTESDVHSLTQLVPSRPLNMEAVVRLPSSIKLTQAPNHSVNTSLENKLLTATCPSCHKLDADSHFQPVPYKTVMQHFEKTLKMLEEDDDSHPSKVWPPEDRFIKSTGDVGFGSLPAQLARDRETNPSRRYSKETHEIPPVIREIHPDLRRRRMLPLESRRSSTRTTRRVQKKATPSTVRSTRRDTEIGRIRRCAGVGASSPRRAGE